MVTKRFFQVCVTFFLPPGIKGLKKMFFTIWKNTKNQHFANIPWDENWNKKWSSLNLLWMKSLFFIIKLAKNINYIFVLDITDIDDNVQFPVLFKWITKIKWHGYIKIYFLLFNFNFVKTDHTRKFIFAKFFKTGFPRMFMTANIFVKVQISRSL